MGITDTRWSLLPTFSTILLRMNPLAAAFELMFTAHRAYEVGFVNRVAPRGRLMREALALARQIAENAMAG